jgi:hypothetical protein
MMLRGNDGDITAQGADSELAFYWAVSGSRTWNPEVIAGIDSTYSTPAIDLNGTP